jgi:hypothetical protein
LEGVLGENSLSGNPLQLAVDPQGRCLSRNQVQVGRALFRHHSKEFIDLSHAATRLYSGLGLYLCVGVYVLMRRFQEKPHDNAGMLAVENENLFVC